MALNRLYGGRWPASRGRSWFDLATTALLQPGGPRRARNLAKAVALARRKPVAVAGAEGGGTEAGVTGRGAGTAAAARCSWALLASSSCFCSVFN